MKINWCKAAARTAREKCRQQITAKVRIGDRKISELSAADLCSLGVGGHGGDSKSHIIDQDLKVDGGVCSFGISSFDLQDVGEVMDACSNLFSECRDKILGRSPS